MPDTSLLAYLTAAIRWALVVCWSASLVFYVREYRRLRRLNPLIATLIVVIFIDGARTLAESGDFGTWYTARTGLVPYSIFTLLAEPRFVILPKILNLVAAVIIIAFIVRRWFGDVAQQTQPHLNRTFGTLQRPREQSDHDGAGIGLAICRRAAERHRGAITADSAPGQGARFIVTLPARHGVEEQAV